MLKISENNGTKEIGLVTPTPGTLRCGEMSVRHLKMGPLQMKTPGARSSIK